MHLGSIYLIVKDFNAAVDFYEKLLAMEVSAMNMERFAQFEFEGHNISIMNGYFDSRNPGLTVHMGEYTKEYDDLPAISEAENTHKVVLNFWTENLRAERERIIGLGIANHITGIKYVKNVMPYFYFQLMDPDGNVIEVTDDFTPLQREFSVE